MAIKRCVLLQRSPHNTAILFFANSPEHEQNRKAIAKSQRLFRVLESNLLDKVRRTGIPLYRSNEHSQVGDTFGLRFTGAVQSIFDKGYDSLIVIGNDTPQLSRAHLLKTRNLLQQGKTVIGPSTDGGFYLLGLTKAQFNQALFVELPWQRANLFHNIAQLLGTEGNLCQLPMLADIDTTRDIDFLLTTRQAITFAIRQLLKEWCSRSYVLSHPDSKAVIPGYYCITQNKGSPFQVV